MTTLTAHHFCHVTKTRWTTTRIHPNPHPVLFDEQTPPDVPLQTRTNAVPSSDTTPTQLRRFRHAETLGHASTNAGECSHPASHHAVSTLLFLTCRDLGRASTNAGDCSPLSHTTPTPLLPYRHAETSAVPPRMRANAVPSYHTSPSPLRPFRRADTRGNASECSTLLPHHLDPSPSFLTCRDPGRASTNASECSLLLATSSCSPLTPPNPDLSSLHLNSTYHSSR